MMEQSLDIHTAADLERLLKRPSAFASIKVHLPRLSPDQRTQTAHRLTGLAHECGCGAAGTAATLALVTSSPVAASAWWFGAATTTQSITGIIGIMAVAALLGKLLILARSRHQLRAEITALRAIA